MIGGSWSLRVHRRVARARAALALAALACCLFGAGTALARPFDLAGEDWEGLGDFVALARAELGAARVVPTARLDYTKLSRDDAVLIFYPQARLDIESLVAFMSGGGRVLLFDDFGTGDDLLRYFSLQRVPSPAHPAESLRQNPQLAIAEPAGAHPVVHEGLRVVTNHPTGFRHPDLSPILRIRAVGEPDVIVAVAGAVGKGRLLAIGDPSTAMNSMLRYPGNRTFARGMVQYAVADDGWGRRGGRLYVVSGSFEQLGSLGAHEGSFAMKLRAATDSLDEVRESGLSAPFAYALAALFGLGVVLWVGSRAGRPHTPSTPRYARPVSLVEQGGVAGHGAVVGAPKTPRVLAMLELKVALEEELCGLLGLDKVPAADALASQVAERRLLGTEGVLELRQLLLRMAALETMLISKKQSPGRVADHDVVAAATVVGRIVAEARANAAHPHAPGVSP